MFTDKYLKGISEDSRVGSGSVFIKEESITKELLQKVNALNMIAKERE